MNADRDYHGARAEAEIRALIEQRDELAAALREFGRHDSTCEYVTNDPAEHPNCDCGFADALALSRLSEEK